MNDLGSFDACNYLEYAGVIILAAERMTAIRQRLLIDNICHGLIPMVCRVESATRTHNWQKIHVNGPMLVPIVN
jgi:hypothetical protein